MLTLKLEATGATVQDILDAAQEALNSLERGNNSGFDRRDTGDYTFTLDGDESSTPEVFLDFDYRSGSETWVARCTQHGELARGPAHDEVMLVRDEHLSQHSTANNQNP